MRPKIKEKLERIIAYLAEQGYTQQATTASIKTAINASVTVNISNARTYFEMLNSEGYIKEFAPGIWSINAK